MLTNITNFPSSSKFVIFFHDINYFGRYFHYSISQTMREELNERKISNALYYNNQKTNKTFLQTFNDVIDKHKLYDKDIILIGHSNGGSYARYVAKNNPKIKLIITLQSTYYLEYVPYRLKIPTTSIIQYSSKSIIYNNENVIEYIKHDTDDDVHIDIEEDENCYINSFESGDIADNEYAYFYKTDKTLKEKEFKIEEVRKNYYYIYSSLCSIHTLHMEKEVAQMILDRSLS